MPTIIIKRRKLNPPTVDDCRHAVQSFMESEVHRITMLPCLDNKESFIAYQAKKESNPEWFKNDVSELVSRYGEPLLFLCFKEWVQEEEN